MEIMQPRDFIPLNRNQALSLLRVLDDEVDRLTEPQRQAIRGLYFLDGDNRSIEQRLRDGTALTDFIVDETRTINQSQRGLS
jgi:hypothetical protein